MISNIKNSSSRVHVISQSPANPIDSEVIATQVVDVTKENSERLAQLRKNFDEKYKLSLPSELMAL